MALQDERCGDFFWHGIAVGRKGESHMGEWNRDGPNCVAPYLYWSCNVLALHIHILYCIHIACIHAVLHTHCIYTHSLHNSIRWQQMAGAKFPHLTVCILTFLKSRWRSISYSSGKAQKASMDPRECDRGSILKLTSRGKTHDEFVRYKDGTQDNVEKGYTQSGLLRSTE